MKTKEDISTQDIKRSLKATSLFGGMEIFGIGISLIRTKIIALLIGPSGVGLIELFSSTIRLISSLTNFSLSTSAVRDISVSYQGNDKERFIYLTSVFSKIVWFTGLLGAVICLIGAPLWSKFTFGNYSQAISFVALSIVLLLNQLMTGNTVLLQGTGHFRYMAMSSVLGNLIGLFTTIPIYFYLRTRGIVLVLIIAAIISYVLSYVYKNKLKLNYIKLSLKATFKEGKAMLCQGFLLSLNFLYSTIIFYVLRIFITNNGGIEELGLYAASFAIVNTYVGLVFQAMAKEYYPRLASVSSDDFKFNSAINSQIYMVLLILAPLISFFLLCSDYLLYILYSEKFSGANLLLSLSMLGVLFQAPSVCLGYAFLAKADNKAFLTYETIAKSIKLLTDILFYYFWGITGIGISFLIFYLYYTLQCVYICHRLYGFFMQYRIVLRLFVYVTVGGGLIFISTFLQKSYGMAVGSVIVFLICLDSYKQLSKYIEIHTIMSKLFKKK